MMEAWCWHQAKKGVIKSNAINHTHVSLCELDLHIFLLQSLAKDIHYNRGRRLEPFMPNFKRQRSFSSPKPVLYLIFGALISSSAFNQLNTSDPSVCTKEDQRERMKYPDENCTFAQNSWSIRSCITQSLSVCLTDTTSCVVDFVCPLDISPFQAAWQYYPPTNCRECEFHLNIAILYSYWMGELEMAPWNIWPPAHFNCCWC